MLKQEAGKMLADQIIPFWKNLKDDAYGGYYGYVGHDLEIDPKAEKGCILNSRILWFFSECAKAFNSSDCLEYAGHATHIAMIRSMEAFTGALTIKADLLTTASTPMLRHLLYMRFLPIMRHQGKVQHLIWLMKYSN